MLKHSKESHMTTETYLKELLIAELTVRRVAPQRRHRTQIIAPPSLNKRIVEPAPYKIHR